MYRRYGKRALDLILVVPALILLAPFMAILALLIRIKMGSPVLFTQERAGKDGKPFKLYKFRSMTNARDAQGNLLPDEQRLTPFGKFLRSTSLDELPQLFNVLRGELSLVGPRPLLMRYIDRYTPEQRRRLDVLPGITCEAVLHGRSNQTWDEILAHDVWYVDHISLWTDLRILFGTMRVVLTREGVERSANGQIPEFLGVLAQTQGNTSEAHHVRQS
ncbi:MAG: sugar transferase [Roseiflexus sp.]|nr:sugar transferase [Roseiflexus sp.]MCS7289790.1 sugar transferase [Roseiflexus sp.]MDW8145727.1 sugar transferase [Roseiflexaceae bacterium]MDW8232495.1 sugar transferase [Roseiflexaceae bacterium]